MLDPSLVAGVRRVLAWEAAAQDRGVLFGDGARAVAVEAARDLVHGEVADVDVARRTRPIALKARAAPWVELAVPQQLACARPLQSERQAVDRPPRTAIRWSSLRPPPLVARLVLG